MALWLRQNSCLVWEAKREGKANGHINDLFSHPNRTRAAIGWQCSCVSSESSRALDAGERNLWRYWPGAAWKSLTPAGQLTSLVPLMAQATEHLQSQWQDGEVIDLAQQMMQLTLAISLGRERLKSDLNGERIIGTSAERKSR